VLFRFADLLFDSTFPVLTVLGALGAMLVVTLRSAENAILLFSGIFHILRQLYSASK
jgi:uncharacterized membrane protein